MSFIEDLILRITSQAPFTTKGSPLTNAEIDANMIIIGNEIIGINNPGGVEAYGGGIIYFGTHYVSYDSKLWKHIYVGGTTTGVTPGTDAARWQRVSIGELITWVQASDLKRFPLTGWQDVPKANIDTIFSSPVELVAAKANVGFELITVAVRVKNWVADYSTNMNLRISVDTADNFQGNITGFLAPTKNLVTRIQASNATAGQGLIVANKKLQLIGATGDPTGGNFDIQINGYYREIDLS